MATTMLRSIHNQRAFYVLGLFSLLMLIQKGGAYEFTVGGSQGWTLPTDASEHFNQWAEKTRFQIGDTLLFVYPAYKDSVLQVTQDDYTNCSTAAPIATFADGHTVVQLSQSGPHYFISGVKDNCLKNEKLVVVVLADRKNQTSLTSPPPGSPEPVPSPAPSGETPPSPPSGPVEINPSPAPTGNETPAPTPPPPSAASSIVFGFIGSFGAFLGSSLLLIL